MSPLRADRAEQILERAEGLRVLVVGDLMLDRYISGEVERISPEAPVPVVRVSAERVSLGGAGNVAANVTALGAACEVAGSVGADAEGGHLMEALERCGVAPSGVVRDESRGTTVKTRVLARHQQIVRFDREADADVSGAAASRLAARVSELAARSDVLVVQDYDKGSLAPEVVQAVLAAAASRDLPVVVDPKRRRFHSYPGVTVLKPNARELQDALGERARPEDAAWMQAVRTRLGCRHLLVTLGDRGMALQTSDGEHVFIPTGARAVFDVSGAGDTVTAAVAVALGAGAGIEEAAALSNHAAAVGVGKAGVQAVAAEEVLAHVRAHPAH